MGRYGGICENCYEFFEIRIKTAPNRIVRMGCFLNCLFGKLFLRYAMRRFKAGYCAGLKLLFSPCAFAVIPKNANIAFRPAGNAYLSAVGYKLGVYP